MKFCENARFSLYSYFMQKCGFDKKRGGDFCSVNSAGALIKTMIFISLLQWDLTDLQS